MKEEKSYPPHDIHRVKTIYETASTRYDPGDTITRWQVSSLSEVESGIEVSTKSTGRWPDEESRQASERLVRKGIKIPWDYDDEFGESGWKVAGLRAGGIGVVYFVEHLEQDRKKIYAAKTLNSFLKPDYLDLSPPMQEKISLDFLEETLPWLEMGQHQNIVAVQLLKNIIYPGSMRSLPFIFSEFIPRGNLRKYLCVKGKLWVGDSLKLGIQLCDGLLHAYNHGLEAHRDIKPENIMVLEDNLYKVTDFGGNTIGTPAYMAPEQVALLWHLRGEKIVSDPGPVNHRSDQFAVGLVVLESCLGNRPTAIYHDTPQDQELAIRYVNHGVGEIENPSLSDGLKDILRRTLSVDPHDRYPNLSALRDDMAALLEAEAGTYEMPEFPKDDSAEWWFNRGIAFHALGRSAPAEIPFRKALERYSTIPGAETDQARCRMGLGNVFRITGRFPEAKGMYEEALENFTRISGRELEEAKCRMHLGSLHCVTGHFLEAENAYRKALEIHRRLPDSELQQASTIANLGIVFGITGRSKEAEEMMEEAIGIYRDIPGTEFHMAVALMDLGNVYYTTNRFTDAERMYQKAVEMYRGIPGTEYNQARCLTNIGCVYKDTGRFEEAEKILSGSLKILNPIPGTDLDRAATIMTLGEAYSGMGRYPEAREALEEALEMFRGAPGTELDQAQCFENLGCLIRNAEDFTRAVGNFQEALRIYSSFPGTEIDQARCLTEFAFCCLRMNDIPNTKDLVDRAVELCKPFPPEVTVKIRDRCNSILEDISP